MAFLDETPQRWDRPEFPALRDLLVQAYPRRQDAYDLAAEAGLLVGTFPEHDSMRTTWTALIRVLGDQARLRALVEKAAADPHVASYRSRLTEMLSAEPSVPVPYERSTDGSWWRGSDESPKAAERLRLERLMSPRSRLVGIELAEQVIAMARSVAKLSLRFGGETAFGTGFLIADDRLLTNHHNVYSKYGAVTSVVAEFDHDLGEHEVRLVRRGIVDSIISDPAGDWAVVTLESAVDRPPLKLGTPFEVSIDDLVVIIQHPLGAFKKFALEPLAVRYVDKDVIQYVADTQQGSSGSPVFNEKMHVIALHRAEAQGDTEATWRNQGSRIEPIMRWLYERGVAFETNCQDHNE
ncbi:trypsin-like peptidase domain-containing protein [Microbispora cellulosiformans]|uniref:Serine protease n=1 Tax=Microbispora cellulosiformans TaxID=2614688 RepID=A0A5J5JZQ4_9ACTN|nr:trypsin-like peptidase domain-containing protein [Microbispora cellulosiformans]KAA9376029.1 trypsin-like peptidase domain-containing protein [Microbispora cellulosiformans]